MMKTVKVVKGKRMSRTAKMNFDHSINEKLKHLTTVERDSEVTGEIVKTELITDISNELLTGIIDGHSFVRREILKLYRKAKNMKEKIKLLGLYERTLGEEKDLVKKIEINRTIVENPNEVEALMMFLRKRAEFESLKNVQNTIDNQEMKRSMRLKNS